MVFHIGGGGGKAFYVGCAAGITAPYTSNFIL
jgi:hypothetical protein